MAIGLALSEMMIWFLGSDYSFFVSIEGVFRGDSDAVGEFPFLRFLILLVDVFHQPLKFGVDQGFPHEILMAVFGHKLQRDLLIFPTHFNCKIIIKSCLINEKQKIVIMRISWTLHKMV